MQIGQLTNGLDRDHPYRVLRAGDQDRPTFTEQLTAPTALATLLGSGKAGALQQHDRLKIISAGRQDADLGVA
jgi:hypothetical protein